MEKYDTMWYDRLYSNKSLKKSRVYLQGGHNSRGELA